MKKKRNPRSMMVMRCDEQYAVRIRAHLGTVFGSSVGGMYQPIPNTQLVKLVLSFPESMADVVLASAKAWIEERAPEGKELCINERARR